MPVTARLSRVVCERLGDEVVSAMVDGFNPVDATYHANLRELNELDFARFDAKLEQRVAELRAELVQCMANLEALVERRLGEQSRWLFAIFVATAIALWFRR